jgi:hypothetical protein
MVERALLPQILGEIDQPQRRYTVVSDERASGLLRDATMVRMVQVASLSARALHLIFSGLMCRE